jgi:phosphoribosylaminoimidazole-succinocarboxamide synthase
MKQAVDRPPFFNTVSSTDFNFPGQKGVYKGKVRDVYTLDRDLILVIATDRISAFDVILPRAIPEKGKVLNLLSKHFLESSRDICPNWLLATPDPNVSVGLQCEPIRIEMVIRGYLAGHAWREYKNGKQQICGIPFPTGMRESDPFPSPIITPSTKATEGHDRDISKDEILESNLVPESIYNQMEEYSYMLYERGVALAKKKGLILVDTKYEFGLYKGEVYLIDEIHTPDSSRYFLSEGYEERQARNESQIQLSKEFVREWLMANDFQGLDNQLIPEMGNEIVLSISEKYINLYEKLTGMSFPRSEANTDLIKRIESNVLSYLSKL